MRFSSIAIISIILLATAVCKVFAEPQAAFQSDLRKDKAKIFFESGSRSLEGRSGNGGAKKLLDEAKTQLQKYADRKFDVEELSQILENGVAFVDFFNWIGQKADSKTDAETVERIKSLYRQAAYKFRDAIADFNMAIELNPKYTDAYLKAAEASMEIGMFSEAVKAYQSAKSIDFEGLSLPFYEAKHIFYKMSQLYSQIGWNSDLSKPEPEVEVIRDLMAIGDKTLRKQLQNTEDDSEIQKIENQMLINRFELTNFLVQVGRGRSARDEYELQRSQLQSKLNQNQLFYSEAADQIAALEANIRGSTVSFFRIKIDPLLSHAPIKIRILPSDVKLLIDRTLIWFGSDAPSLKMADEVKSDLTMTEFGRSLPSGGYLFTVDFPKIAVRQENRIPLELTLHKGINYEEKLLEDQSKNSLKDASVISDRSLHITLKNPKNQSPPIEIRGGTYDYQAGQITAHQDILEDEYEMNFKFTIPHKFVVEGEEYKIVIRSSEPVESKVKSRLTASSAILVALILSAVYR